MSYAQYFAIEKRIRNQGFDVSRQEIIKQFTNDRKSSLKDLTATEYNALLHWLNQRFPSAPVTPQPSPDNEAKQRKRRKIIALLCQVGMVKGAKPDMERINAWCESHGHGRKKLNFYTDHELVKLVTQAENMYKKHIERL